MDLDMSTDLCFVMWHSFPGWALLHGCGFHAPGFGFQCFHGKNFSQSTCSTESRDAIFVCPFTLSLSSLRFTLGLPESVYNPRHKLSASCYSALHSASRDLICKMQLMQNNPKLVCRSVMQQTHLITTKRCNRQFPYNVQRCVPQQTCLRSKRPEKILRARCTVWHWEEKSIHAC